MKRIVFAFLLLSFFAFSCMSGHRSQTWAPKSGKKMKGGHNRR